MKQTAVEWFYKMISNAPEDISESELRMGYKFLFEQALEMEKEQIIDAHIEGQRVFDEHAHTQWTNDQAEHYYTETYKTNKQ